VREGRKEACELRLGEVRGRGYFLRETMAMVGEQGYGGSGGRLIVVVTAGAQEGWDDLHGKRQGHGPPMGRRRRAAPALRRSRHRPPGGAAARLPRVLVRLAPPTPRPGRRRLPG